MQESYFGYLGSVLKECSDYCNDVGLMIYRDQCILFCFLGRKTFYLYIHFIFINIYKICRTTYSEAFLVMLLIVHHEISLRYRNNIC